MPQTRSKWYHSVNSLQFFMQNWRALRLTAINYITLSAGQKKSSQTLHPQERGVTTCDWGQEKNGRSIHTNTHQSADGLMAGIVCAPLFLHKKTMRYNHVVAVLDEKNRDTKQMLEWIAADFVYNFWRRACFAQHSKNNAISDSTGSATQSARMPGHCSCVQHTLRAQGFTTL